jgi:hypothetical protein
MHLQQGKLSIFLNRRVVMGSVIPSVTILSRVGTHSVALSVVSFDSLEGDYRPEQTVIRVLRVADNDSNNFN